MDVETWPADSVDLDRAVLALSDALDFIGVDDVGHGHRVALMSVAVARELGWEGEAIHDLLWAGLLHDCGVSTTREHKVLVDEIDWEGSRGHSIRGADFLASVPSLAHLAPVVREHHTHWEDLRHSGLAPDQALAANIIYLTDRADAVRAMGMAPGREVAECLEAHAGTRFAPQAVAVLRDLAAREVFWFIQDDPALHERIAEIASSQDPRRADMAEIKAIATMFGHIIDAKSPYTERHSIGVSRAARLLGHLFGRAPDVLDRIEIAGLLHDLGKLRIPDQLIEKQGPLSADERRTMARHSFDTWEVLRHVFGEGDISQWAAFHHEAMSWQGYPFHRDGEDLPLEARIVAVADVFQALAQKRPYRTPLSAEEIAGILDGMVFGGKLDRDVVLVLKNNMDACLMAALSSE